MENDEGDDYNRVTMEWVDKSTWNRPWHGVRNAAFHCTTTQKEQHSYDPTSTAMHPPLTIQSLGVGVERYGIWEISLDTYPVVPQNNCILVALITCALLTEIKNQQQPRSVVVNDVIRSNVSPSVVLSLNPNRLIHTRYN